MRIAFATAIAAVIASVVNLGIQEFGRRVLVVPAEFEPYHGTVVPYTIAGVVLAGITYWIVCRFARDARRIYLGLSIVALLLSYIPDVLLVVWNDPGATIPAVLSLMAMHTAAAAIVVGLLLTVAPLANDAA